MRILQVATEQSREHTHYVSIVHACADARDGDIIFLHQGVHLLTQTLVINTDIAIYGSYEDTATLLCSGFRGIVADAKSCVEIHNIRLVARHTCANLIMARQTTTLIKNCEFLTVGDEGDEDSERLFPNCALIYAEKASLRIYDNRFSLDDPGLLVLFVTKSSNVRVIANEFIGERKKPLISIWNNTETVLLAYNLWESNESQLDIGFYNSSRSDVDDRNNINCTISEKVYTSSHYVDFVESIGLIICEIDDEEFLSTFNQTQYLEDENEEANYIAMQAIDQLNAVMGLRRRKDDFFMDIEMTKETLLKIISTQDAAIKNLQDELERERQSGRDRSLYSDTWTMYKTSDLDNMSPLGYYY